MTAADSTQQAQWKRWRVVADLYHAYFTGLILTVVTRRGTDDAAEFVFRVFRRQQQERFLPGLQKLGLDHLPPAVAAAQYHYLSNWIGGVHVEYMYESDTKAWIRYPPPRWIWKGTAICGVPGEVSRAPLMRTCTDTTSSAAEVRAFTTRACHSHLSMRCRSVVGYSLRPASCSFNAASFAKGELGSTGRSRSRGFALEA